MSGRTSSMLWFYASVLLLLAAATSGNALLTNPGGASVDALSAEIDSSEPEMTNPAGALTPWASSGQTSPDIANTDAGRAFVGLFDPAFIYKNAAREWMLYP